MIGSLRAWPRRRWVAAAALFPVVATLIALAGGTGTGGPTPWWAWPWLAVTGALASIVLATYVPAPGSGRLIELGCRRCAAGAAVVVTAAVLVHSFAPASPILAAVATVLAAAASVRRLTDAAACPAAPAAEAAGQPPAPLTRAR